MSNNPNDTNNAGDVLPDISEIFNINDEQASGRTVEKTAETPHRSERILTAEEGVKHLPKPERKKMKKAARKERRAAAPDNSLFETLRRVRATLAQEAGVPAYIVFSNATLTDMAVRRPVSMQEFLHVSGVGQYKAERYGAPFLEAIQKWLREN